MSNIDEIEGMLRQRGATEQDLALLRRGLQKITVQNNYGVVAEQIAGPVAAGSRSKAFIKAEKQSRVDSTSSEDSTHNVSEKARPFWDRAKSIAATAASTSGAVKAILEIAKISRGLG